MANAIDRYAEALSVLSKGPELQDTRQGLIAQVAREGLLQQVTVCILDMAGSSSASSALSDESSVDPAQSASGSMSTPSPLAADCEHEDTTLQPCSVSANPRCEHPKVVIDQQRPRISKPQRKQNGTKLLSQLQWRALTESSEESCSNAGPARVTTDPAESSEDELSYDNPRPPPSAAVLPALPTPQTEPIEWVFWTQSDAQTGQWRPLSDFPSATQTLLVRKFDAYYSNTPKRVELFARMLRNRDDYVRRDICVGNVTYWRGNTPKQWKNAQGDKQKACDTCVRAERLCARAVEVDGAVKLGFFPLPGGGGQGVGWSELRHWIMEH